MSGNECDGTYEEYSKSPRQIIAQLLEQHMDSLAECQRRKTATNKGDLANIKRGDSISESDCDCELMEKV